MKKHLLFLLSLFAAGTLSAQCSVEAQLSFMDCGSCEGSAAAINPTGAPPFTYSWSNGDTTAAADSLCMSTWYYVTMTDSLGCTAVDSTMAMPFGYYFSHQVTNTSCPTCCDGTDTVFFAPPQNTCGPLMYQWHPAQQFPDTLNYATGLCAGTYTVIIYDSGCNNCLYTFSSTVGFDMSTGIAETSAAPAIRVENGLLLISSDAAMEKIELYDLSGRLLLQRACGGTNESLALDGFAASPLIARIYRGDGLHVKLLAVF